MKHNIIFAVLTAVILISGFFTMDIVQYFSNNTSEESFKSISKGESNAVYLSSERAVINPMSMITQSDEKADQKISVIASSIVNAMSRYNETAYIAWGLDDKLENSWKNGGDDFIYVEKWRYMNYGKKSERLLDCIINKYDFNIIYIRFYSDEKHKLSSSELNKGLEIISNESMSFYPHMNEIIYAMEHTLQDIHENTEIYEQNDYNDYYNFSNIGIEKIIDNYYYNDYSYLMRECVKVYNNMKNFVNYYLGDSQLYTFWLSPLDMNSIVVADVSCEEDGIKYDIRESLSAYPVHYLVLECFPNISSWFHPSYYSKDGRIYQSFLLTGGKISVIYSVKENMIEGFYFEQN